MAKDPDFPGKDTRDISDPTKPPQKHTPDPTKPEKAQPNPLTVPKG